MTIPNAIVETNWILDVALQQDAASLELFDHAKAGRVKLFLPTFCIAEAIKSIESKQAELKRVLADQLPRLNRELSRSVVTHDACQPIDQATVAIAATHDAITGAFWPVLRDIVAVVTQLAPRSETIELTADLQDSLKLSPADSLVLASAILAAREGVCQTFMSRDGEFAEDVIRDHIAAEGLTFHANALPIVGPLRK